MKEQISGNFAKVRRKSDRVLAIVLTLGRKVMQIVCVYEPQSEKPDTEKFCFYGEMVIEWDLEVLVKSLLLWGFQ